MYPVDIPYTTVTTDSFADFILIALGTVRVNASNPIDKLQFVALVEIEQTCIWSVVACVCVTLFKWLFIYSFYYTSRTRSKKRKYNNYTKLNTQNYK